MRVGVKQGIMQGITVGTTNCVFLCSYALAFWYGSTRVRAGKYDGRPPPAFTPLDHTPHCHKTCQAYKQQSRCGLVVWELRHRQGRCVGRKPHVRGASH